MTNKTSNREAFMQALMNISEPHPTLPDTRIVGGTTVKIESESDFPLRPDEVYIHTLEASEKRRGQGSSALRAITPLADQFGLTIWTHAVPTSNEPEAPSSYHLSQFYGQHGFRKQAGFRAENLMYREPAKEAPRPPGR